MDAKCYTDETARSTYSVLATSTRSSWPSWSTLWMVTLAVLFGSTGAVLLVPRFWKAAKSRSRASVKAVGKSYHALSRTTFDFRDWTFSTTVQTPIIDLETILRSVPEFGGPRVRSSGHGKLRSKWSDMIFGDVCVNTPRPLAGWACFLEDASLDWVDFEKRSVCTDHLPADDLAAPALVSVESLFIIAMISGCDEVQPVHETIEACGSFMQVSQDYCPRLGGDVAIYTNLHPRRSGNYRDSLLLRSRINQALGRLTLSGKIILEPLYDSYSRETPATGLVCPRLKQWLLVSTNECKHNYCMNEQLRADILEDGNQVSLSSLFRYKHASLIGSFMVADVIPGKQIFPHSAWALEGLAWEFVAAQRRILDAVPTRTAIKILPKRYYEGIEFVKDSADTASTRIHCETLSSSWIKSSATDHVCRDPKGCYDFHGGSGDATQSKLNWVKGRQAYGHPEQLRTLQLRENALSHLEEWIYDVKHFAFVKKDNELELAVSCLYEQLVEIDTWLARANHNAVGCAVRNVLYTSRFLFQKDPEPREDSPERPTYLRISTKYLVPETLAAYNLPWTYEDPNRDYIIIHQFLDHDLTQEVFAHTKKLKSERHGARGQPLETIVEEPGDPGDEHAACSTHRQQTSVPQDSILGSNFSLTHDRPHDSTSTNNSGVHNHHCHGQGQEEDEFQEDNSIAKEKDCGKEDRKREPGSANDAHDQEKSQDAAYAPESNEMSRDEREVETIETVLTLRVLLHMALLSTGADSSLILTSPKRHQLLQMP